MRGPVFLTGGTGFFGKSILSMIQRKALPDAEWFILSREPDRFCAENPVFATLKQVHFLQGDIRDFRFPEREFPCIIHAAAPARTDLPPGEQKDIILSGTKRVLEFARLCGCRKLLFTSSGAVYGPQPPELERIPENFPCHPVTEYGMAKADAEKMCLDSGICTLIARCFAFTGPYLNRNIHFAIGNFIRDALSGSPIVIQGDGTPFRSYLYADDLVKWLFTILERGINGRPYNVGNGDGISIRELAETVRKNLNSQSPIIIRGTPVPDRPPSRYVPDVSRAETEFGLKAGVPLREAILKSAFPEGNPILQ